MDSEKPTKLLSSMGLNRSGNSLIGIEVEKILCDRRALIEILDICNERNKLYRNVNNFMLMSGEGNPCFFLDFDIIYGYLVGGIAGRTLFAEIDYFFEVSSFDYAIPQGAYEELIDYLSKNLSIGELFQEVNAPSISEDSLIETLENLLNGDSGSLNEQFIRLCNILINDRFHGIVHKCDPTIQGEALNLLQSHHQAERHRYGNRDRSDNMKRDADNLAIVLSQYDPMYKNSKLPHSWFVLLSSTSSVNKISKKLCQSRSITPWATVIPKLVIMAEFMEFESQRNRAFFNTRAIFRGWQTLENKISQQLYELKAKSSEQFDLDTKATAIELKRDIDKILESEASIKTEKAICQFKSIEELQAKQRKKSVHEITGLNAKRECLRVLDTLRGAIAKLEPKETYRIIPLLTDQVNRKIGIKPNNQSFSSDVFLELSFIFDTTVLSGMWANWGISCDDGRFVFALTELFPSITQYESGIEVEQPRIISTANEKKLIHSDGIVIRNASFAYFMPMSLLKRYGAWNTLKLNDLYQLQMVFARHFSNGSVEWQRPNELIHEIQVNSGGIEITYEIIPKDKSVGRQLTVFATQKSTNFSRDVALLYDWTGMRFAYRSVLEDALKRAITLNISNYGF